MGKRPDPASDRASVRQPESTPVDDLRLELQARRADKDQSSERELRVTVKVWQIPILLFGLAALLYVIGQSAFGTFNGAATKPTVARRDTTPATVSRRRAPAKRTTAPVERNGTTNPQKRLAAMLTAQIPNVGNFKVHSCTPHDLFNSQKGFDCAVDVGAISKMWHIELANDGYEASAWRADDKTDCSTLTDPPTPNAGGCR
jgi:hypothetical protein